MCHMYPTMFYKPTSNTAFLSVSIIIFFVLPRSRCDTALGFNNEQEGKEEEQQEEEELQQQQTWVGALGRRHGCSEVNLVLSWVTFFPTPACSHLRWLPNSGFETLCWKPCVLTACDEWSPLGTQRRSKEHERSNVLQGTCHTSIVFTRTADPSHKLNTDISYCKIACVSFSFISSNKLHKVGQLSLNSFFKKKSTEDFLLY